MMKLADLMILIRFIFGMCALFLKKQDSCGGPPMAPGGGNATIFEEGGSGNGSGGAGGGRGGVGGGGEVEVEEFRFEDI
ncbi:unnamed protein product [Rhizophagus irregularis]|nr:unnamed protein product [Rhizophagus irregularis]